MLGTLGACYDTGQALGDMLRGMSRVSLCCAAAPASPPRPARPHVRNPAARLVLSPARARRYGTDCYLYLNRLGSGEEPLP